MGDLEHYCEDGRHRVIQAFQEGYDRIEVTVKRGDPTVKTTIPVAKAMEEMGVDLSR
jgi:hypothetical protein